MGNPNTAHEPSMEEILASIRQIISEDGDSSAAPKAEVPSEVQTSPAAEADPDQPDSFVSHFEPESEPEPAPVEEVRVRPRAPVPMPEPAAERFEARRIPASTPREPATRADEAQLLSPEKGKAISGAFGALAHTILAQNSRTLEDVVSEMLQPMLKSWLDDNLPTIVERMIKDEIERVSRGRR